MLSMPLLFAVAFAFSGRGPNPNFLTAIAGAVALPVLVYIAWMTIRTVRETPVFIDRLIGLACNTTVIVLEFALIYWALSPSPGSGMNVALSKVDSVYFTLTTLTTVGFGDIVPTSELCRGIVSIQLVFGLALIGGAFAVLVSGLSRSDG